MKTELPFCSKFCAEGKCPYGFKGAENQQGPTLSDCKGNQRIRKLQERSQHIDEHMRELADKKEIIEHEIQQIRKEME